jgi:hypothetical protein
VLIPLSMRMNPIKTPIRQFGLCGAFQRRIQPHISVGFHFNAALCARFASLESKTFASTLSVARSCGGVPLLQFVVLPSAIQVAPSSTHQARQLPPNLAAQTLGRAIRSQINRNGRCCWCVHLRHVFEHDSLRLASTDVPENVERK